MSGSDEDNLSGEDDIQIVEENTEQIEQNNAPEEVNENQEAAAETEDKKEVKVKRVRNPQPKLNVERLKGPRGLQILEKVFQDVKFKGRGHEEEDLCVLMKNYEYWCHRLFPKFPFDDCLERMEGLGTKKPLQTYVKRIRMDLLLDDDNVEQQLQDDEVINGNVSDHEEIDNFDALLPRPTQTQPQPTNSGSTGLTEEQLERIRINRERAQRVRQQTLIRNKPTVNSSQSSQVNTGNNIVSSQSPNIVNSWEDVDFIGNMSLDSETNTNVFQSQNSIEGESFCFQTTALVHVGSERIANKKTVSVEHTPIISEAIDCQKSVDYGNLDAITRDPVDLDRNTRGLDAANRVNSIDSVSEIISQETDKNAPEIMD